MNTMRASIEYRIDRLVGSADVRVVHDYAGQFDVEPLKALLEVDGVEAGGGRLGGSLTLIRTDEATDESGRTAAHVAMEGGYDQCALAMLRAATDADALRFLARAA